MRDVTIVQATDEIALLDKLSASLQAAIRRNYDELRSTNPAVNFGGGDIEIAAKLHNNTLGLTEALEEVGRRGYGRVVYVRQVDDSGNVIRTHVYRLSQANAGLAEAGIVARNNPLGSLFASCRVGEDLEIQLPSGERYFVVTALIDLEGAVQLLRPQPDIALARFRAANDPNVDTIRRVRAFLETIKSPPEVESLEPPSSRQEKLSKEKPEPSLFERFWPSDWSKVMLADEPEAALGAQFFTKTTRLQEEAVKAVRGVTVVNGIAGTGKTSIALGRLKFFANFRSGEHLQDYGLNPNDWADFNSSDMVGFVLSPSLVQYLKQTAEDLEMRIKIVDFEEFRNQERQSRRIFGRPFKRSPDQNHQIQQTVIWLRALAKVASTHVADAIEKIQMEPLVRPSTPDGSRITDARWREIDGQLWRAGPLRGRITGLVRHLRSEGPIASFRLQGIGNTIDRDVRLSDRETVALVDPERRALREAVLNISLRFFRLLNPSELYVAIHNSSLLKPTLAAHYETQLDVASEAAQRTAARLDERLVTDDDLVTALCLNAVTCDEFEREIREIPYLHTF